jgi:integral membrane protein
MPAAVIRFRVVAYVVGVFLLVLVFVAMPLKYFADQPTLVAIIGPVHGFLYMIYLVVAFDLAVRAKWPFGRTVLVLLAGTIPVMSFVAERKVTAWTRQAAQPTPASV